jgi:hypothetical protein
MEYDNDCLPYAIGFGWIAPGRAGERNLCIDSSFENPTWYKDLNAKLCPVSLETLIYT